MSGADEPTASEDEQRRRSVVLSPFVVLAVRFVGVAAAVLGPLSPGETGELAVTLVDQNGGSASGQEV